MKLLKHIAAFIVSIVCMGTVYAYPQTGYPDRIVLAQQRVVVRDVHAGVVVVQPRQRRFVMPPNGAVYQRGAPQYMPPPNAPRPTRMTVEERRALRIQINEANQGIYRNNRARGAQP